MKLGGYVILMSCLTASLLPSAQALTLSTLGVVDLATPSISATPSADVKSGVGFGGGVELGIWNQSFSYHLGIFLNPKSYSYTSQGINTRIHEVRLLIPATVRWNPSILFLEAGGYLSSGLTQPSVSTTLLSTTVNST